MSGSVLNLVRPELRDFGGYGSARRSAVSGSIWLNANESSCANPADRTAMNQRYPAPQPEPLRQALARLYGVSPDRLLIGRGSDEAIDLLVRALCRPEHDAVVISSPVFGMYAVSARLQNAALIDVPLLDDDAGFRLDTPAVMDAAARHNAHVVFVCSPGNPTGHVVALDEIAQLASRLAGQSLVVVDEAYVEYSDQASALTLLDAHPNLAVLRTLSKAHALAGARIGSLIADPQLIGVLRNCQAPYPLPAPCVELALAAVAPETLAQTTTQVTQTCHERARLFAASSSLAGVVRVYPSHGNFLLLRFADAEAALQQLLAAGVVVRDQRAAPQLGDALRISIGTREENDAVVAALSALENPA